MASLNRVFLIGNLTRDPELRYTPGGTAVADLRLASSRRWTGPDGQPREETLYIDVAVFDKQAEAAAEHLVKGSPVLVEGRLRSREWEGKDGQRRTAVEVVAERVQFLGRPRQEAHAAPAQASSPSPDDEAPF